MVIIVIMVEIVSRVVMAMVIRLCMLIIDTKVTIFDGFETLVLPSSREIPKDRTRECQYRGT